MHQKQAQVQPQSLWQALSPRQQQQLLALLGQWTLRCWKAQRTTDPRPALPPGGRNEHR